MASLAREPIEHCLKLDQTLAVYDRSLLDRPKAVGLLDNEFL